MKVKLRKSRKNHVADHATSRFLSNSQRNAARADFFVDIEHLATNARAETRHRAPVSGA